MINTATDSNTVAKTYTWGLDLSGDLQGTGGVGGLLSTTEITENTEETYYATYDANGNISEYVDDSDSVVAHYEYSPFGKITSSSGSKSSDFRHRFSTKYRDSETALYYYGYRYYSNDLGRWISRDPIEERGGLNTYALISNSSVNLYDFLGMRSCEDLGGTVKNETCCCGDTKFNPEEKCCKRDKDVLNKQKGSTGVQTCVRHYKFAIWHAYIKVGSWTMGWAGDPPSPEEPDESRRKKCKNAKRRNDGVLPDGTPCACAPSAKLKECVRTSTNWPSGTYQGLGRNCGNWVKELARRCCMKAQFPWNIIYGPNWSKWE